MNQDKKNEIIFFVLGMIGSLFLGMSVNNFIGIIGFILVIISFMELGQVNERQRWRGDRK